MVTSIWCLCQGSKRSHTGGKCVTCSGLTNSRWTLNALQRAPSSIWEKRRRRHAARQTKREVVHNKHPRHSFFHPRGLGLECTSHQHFLQSWTLLPVPSTTRSSPHCLPIFLLVSSSSFVQAPASLLIFLCPHRTWPCQHSRASLNFSSVPSTSASCGTYSFVFCVLSETPQTSHSLQGRLWLVCSGYSLNSNVVSGLW